MGRKLVSVQISSELFLELANYLQEFGDERDRAEVVEGALASWLAVARGETRNAWRDLWLRLPGQRYWKNAAFIRSEQLRGPRPEPVAAFRPHDAVAAPAVMAQSLRNALALIEKAASRRHGKLERRTDILPDD